MNKTQALVDAKHLYLKYAKRGAFQPEASYTNHDETTSTVFSSISNIENIWIDNVLPTTQESPSKKHNLKLDLAKVVGSHPERSKYVNPLMDIPKPKTVADSTKQVSKHSSVANDSIISDHKTSHSQ